MSQSVVFTEVVIKQPVSITSIYHLASVVDLKNKSHKLEMFTHPFSLLITILKFFEK